MNRVLILAVLFLSITCTAAMLAFSETARADDDFAMISIAPTDAPAVDLMYQGKPIDMDQAVTLRKKGVDLSTLDPVANDMFGKPAPSTPAPLPEDGASVDYDSALAGFGHEISIHRVMAGGIPLRLDVSTVPHRALLTRALLAKLGYNQYAPKRYTKLTVHFHSLDERSQFLDSLALDTVKDPNTWVVSQPTTTPDLELRDVLLEPGSVDIQNFYWAVLAQDFSENRRALRAALVPISLCDAPENIDSYGWDGVRVFSNDAMVPYPHEIEGQRPFDGVAIEDVQWISRKIAKLTAADWKAIVAQARYPDDIAEIVLQKLLSRREQLLATAKISAPKIAYDTHLNNTCVKNGEVTCASFEGYASRFTYGAADDPMSPSELGDFGVLKGIDAALETLAGQINQQLIVFSTSQAAQQQAQKVMNGFLQHMAQNPGQPYVAPLSLWGAPVGGFSLNASRQVTTGTFYGSDAPIQFVDTVGVGASIGYFAALSGLKNLIPTFQVGLSVNRTYAHVRPLGKVSDGLKVPAKDFIVPLLLKDLAVILANPSTATAPLGDKAKQQASYTQAVADFLGKIGDSELFTITDTIAGGPSASVVVPLQALFPAIPVGYNQGITFGGSIQGVIARRTTFRRVHDATSGDDYLQVYVQKLDSVTGSLTLDFNYYINILHVQTDKLKGQAHTRVYTVQNDPQRPENTSRALAGGLRELLRTNSDKALAASYPFYLLDHDVSMTDWQIHFLFLQAKELKEEHHLNIQPPTQDDHPFNPKDFQRTFYSYREQKLSGMNYFAVLGNLVGSATGGQGTLGGGSSDNPAYSPFGSAHWTETYSDAELTKGAAYTPVSITRETWAGWSLSAKQLGTIFDAIDGKLGNLRSFGYRISPIHRNVFAATDSLELYNITSSMIFYANGVNRIVAGLRPPTPPNAKPPTGLGAIGADAYSATDLIVYKNLVTWLGGDAAYYQICLADENNQDEVRPPGGYWRGNYFPCLDYWVSQVLQLRRTMPPSSNREAQLKWQTQILELLEQKAPLNALMTAAGNDGFYFQVQVNGFRKGDNEAKNSEEQEVIASYVSDTVGTADTVVGAGAFNTLANKTSIMPYELNALYFTGGN